MRVVACWISDGYGLAGSRDVPSIPRTWKITRQEQSSSNMMTILSPISRLARMHTSHYSSWFLPDKADFKLFPRSFIPPCFTHTVVDVQESAERWHSLDSVRTGYHKSPGIRGASMRTETVLVHKCSNYRLHVLTCRGNVISPWNRERVRFDSFALLCADFPLPSSGILSILPRFIVDLHL
jgi:hypothetical protein